LGRFRLRLRIDSGSGSDSGSGTGNYGSIGSHSSDFLNEPGHILSSMRDEILVSDRGSRQRNIISSLVTFADHNEV